MARALQLAERGLYTTDPNPRVGCVLVLDDEIVGEGWHERAGEAHAEAMALKAAGKRARGATAYVSLEPCCHHGRTPPCSNALIEAGVGRVIAAMTDPNPRVAGNGLAALRDAGIEVDSGLLESQAQALNPGFIKRMRTGRPFVRVKLAMSLDGRTALASGASRWITGEAAREDVHRLRARSSAVLTGSGTVLNDNPSMNARLDDMADVVQPLRVVLDSRLRMPPEARMLSLPGKTLVLTAHNDAAAIERLREAGAEVAVLPSGEAGIDLNAVLDHLGKLEINEVLVEAGATLSGALLRGGMVDELVVYIAPALMGDAARPLLHLPGITSMQQRVELDVRDLRAIGKDWRITAALKTAG
jgi:diaminohydroxyphosphoribosylaminopyrimidine deaminase/5-amino-6-(5-phosphoribosylamino)uracil reductase